MKLLIEIPEEKYNYFISNRNSYKRSIAESIINGRRFPDDCEILTKEAYADLCMRASKGQEPNCSEIPTGSTTKNDLGVDCISRDDVWDVMQELWGTSGELMDRLMALPSVTPQEPRKGSWISSNGVPYTYFNSFIVCSECGKHPKEKSDFCPNCGSYNGGASNNADMRGEN